MSVDMGKKYKSKPKREVNREKPKARSDYNSKRKPSKRRERKIENG